MTRQTLPPTFRQLVHMFAALTAHTRRKSTAKTERSTLEIALRHFESLEPKIDRPTPLDWAVYLGGLVDRGEVMPSTANARRKVYWRLYEQLRRTAYPLLLNPIDSVPRFMEAKEKPRAIADPARTYPAILAALPDARSKAFVSLLRRHGLRESEGLGMEPKHLQLDRGQFIVEQQRNVRESKPLPLKTDTSVATMAIHPETAELLRQAARDKMRAGLKFEAAGVRRFLFDWHERHVSKLMDVCREVSPTDFPRREVGKVGGTAWHAFRHTFGTELVNADMRIEKIQILMRHKSIATTQGYIASIRGREMPNDALRDFWAAQASAEISAAQPPDIGGATVVQLGGARTEGKS